MPAWMKGLMAIGIAGLICSAIALVMVMNRAPAHAAGVVENADPLAPSERVGGLSIAEFSMLDHDGASRSRDMFLGRVTIIDFMFTDCPFICPMLVGRMLDLSDALKGTDVRFASISVNPSRDTPEKLRDYAALHEADLSRWTFLTGKDGDTAPVNALADSLKFALGPDASRTIPLPDGSTMNNINHPSWLVLIGPKAEVLDVFPASDPAAMKELESRARRADEALGLR